MQRNINLIIKSNSEGFITGDKKLFFKALNNLLQNSLDFSSNNSSILIELDKLVNDQVVIYFRDQGTGIPDYARDKIYSRFYSLERPSTNKKSSGLGLSFVVEILKLHSSKIELIQADTKYCGANFKITCPV